MASVNANGITIEYEEQGSGEPMLMVMGLGAQLIDWPQQFVDVVADYKGDFVVFPEMFVLQLLSIENQQLNPAESIEALSRHTPRFVEAMRDLAIRYNINIIGGSHPTHMPNGRVENIAYIFLRDGAVHQQPKIHPTPNEVYWWNIEGGDSLQVIDTDCGPIGVLICYEGMYPALSRAYRRQGANALMILTNDAWWGDSEFVPWHAQKVAVLAALPSSP